MPISQWFAIAQEGATTDGRKINRETIEQIAKNFDPAVYGARVNLEHIRGMHPESAFRMYGDVIEVKTEARNGKLALLARVDATDELVEFHKKRQKIYSSIEVDYDFSDTGEAYLVGLGMTDSPASLGTEILRFSSQAESNPFSSRKLRPENEFSEALEADLNFDIDQTTSLIDKVKGLFSKHKADQEVDQGLFRKDLENTLELIASKVNEIKSAAGTDQAFTELSEKTQKLQDDFNALKEQLENDDSENFNRPPADGGTEVLTDY